MRQPYVPRPQRTSPDPRGATRCYAIGIVREDGVGMVDGPHPDLLDMLDRTPLDTWAKAGSVELFRFVGSTEATPLFRWVDGGWSDLGRLLPSESTVVDDALPSPDDPLVSDARILADKWRQVAPHIASSTKLSALAEQTAIVLESAAARLVVPDATPQGPGRR